jgi:hypothetical protein
VEKAHATLNKYLLVFMKNPTSNWDHYKLLINGLIIGWLHADEHQNPPGISYSNPLKIITIL